MASDEEDYYDNVLESQSTLEIPDYETQFESQEGDEENMWEVLEITAERKKGAQYKVKWAGTDPATGRAWAQSWVGKRDCTNELIAEWKIKQAEKKRHKERRKRTKSTSTSKSRSVPSSKLSSALNSVASGSTTTPALKDHLDPSRGSPISVKSPRRLEVFIDTKSKKRAASPDLPNSPIRRVSRDVEVSHDFASSMPPKKKRKVMVEVVKVARPSKLFQRREEEEEEEAEVRPTRPAQLRDRSAGGNGKGWSKRVLAREQSEVSEEAVEEEEEEEEEIPINHVGPPREKLPRPIPPDSRRDSGDVLNIAKGSTSKPVEKLATRFTKRPRRQLSVDFTSDTSPNPQKKIHRVVVSEDDEEAPLPPLSKAKAVAKLPSTPVQESQESHFSEEHIGGDIFNGSSPVHNGSHYTYGDEFHLELPLPSPSPPPPRGDPNSTVGTVIPETQSPLHSDADSLLGGSGSVNEKNGRSKLRPIPMISPSKFKPHLREGDILPSSIDQFSSPEKGRTADGSRKERENVTRRSAHQPEVLDDEDGDDDDEDGVGEEDDDFDFSARVQQRGQELAELHRAQGSAPKPVKRPLAAVLKPVRSPIQQSNQELRDEGSVQLVDRAAADMAMVQEMEDQYVNYDEIEVAAESGENERAAAAEVLSEEKHGIESTVEATFEEEEDAIPSDVREKTPEPPEIDRQALPTVTRSPEDTLPATVSSQFSPTRAALLSPRSQPQLQSFERQLNSAMALLNTKSDEIVRLQAELAEEREGRKLLAEYGTRLEAERNEQRRALTTMVDIEKLVELTHEKDLLIADRDALLAERDGHVGARLDAEKDRDFFREQYSTASAYASQVRAENVELETRAAVAAGQARDGVALVRGMYEGMVQRERQEGKQWKGLYEVLRVKDERTGDDIRRRAALEPELREQVRRLTMEVAELKEELEELRDGGGASPSWWSLVGGKGNKATAGEDIRVDPGSSDMQRNPSTSVPMTMGFVCDWASGASYVRCGAVLPTRQELIDHMFSSGHLRE